jgi:hypothetical protein
MSYIYNLTDTWNDAGTTFAGIKMAVTNTSSGASSKLLDLTVSGATTGSFTVDKSGNASASGVLTLGAGTVGAPSVTTTGDTNTGIYFPAADTIGFVEGGVESMRLDASGNLGLGVTPSAWSSLSKVFQNAAGSVYTFGADRMFLGQNTYINASNSDIYVNTAAATTYRQFAGTHAWFNAPSGTAGNAISFTQAMTLDASGNLLVGTTSTPGAGGKLTVSGDNASARLMQLIGTTGTDTTTFSMTITKNANDSTTSQRFIGFLINGGANGSGQINADGASAAAFGSFSDIRLKENITDLPNQLANICALKPSEFDYKDGSGHQIGFIAQDMQQIYPDVIGEGDDGMLIITGWGKTEARLVKAIQELAAEVASLKEQLNG